MQVLVLLYVSFSLIYSGFFIFDSRLNLTVVPGAVRLLDQVGVLEHIHNQIPLFDKIDLTTDNGAVLRQFGLFDSMEEW